jgi:hypothetical protein
MNKRQMAVGLIAGLGWACTTHATILDLGTAPNSGSGTLASPLTWNIGGNTIKATAFYTSNQSGNAALGAATVVEYSPGGLGITAPSSSGESSPATSPYHSIDNNAGMEFLLLDFGAAFTASSFQIGWSASGNSGWQSNPDVQIWTGGGTSANLSLLNDCVASGCATTFSTLGFSKRPVNANTAINTNTTISGATTGRYMIVSGALGSQGTNGLDGFKFRKVTGGYSLPEPSSMALLGLGFVGLMFFRPNGRFIG